MKQRIRELDGLRAVAILAVYLRHTVYLPLTWMGVDLFFVLSGFLITGILLDAPKQSFWSYIGAFYARRVRRILPPYLLIILVATLVYGTVTMEHWGMYFGLMNLRAQFFPHDHILRSLNMFWSLAVEEQFYFFWPVVVFFAGVRKLPRVLVAMIVLAPIFRVFGTLWAQHQVEVVGKYFVYSETPFRMDCLATGALLTLVWRAHSEKVRRYGHYALALVVLMPCLSLLMVRVWPRSSAFENSVHGNVLSYELALVTVTSLMVWGLSGKYTGVLRWPVMQWLARISYSFFLVHLTAVDVVGRYVHRTWLTYVLGFVASVVYGELSWRLMERPLLHGGSHKVARRELHSATPDHGRMEAQEALETL